jgi:hypothetical protein
MERRGRPWQEIAETKPFANEPFGLVGTVFNIRKIREWRGINVHPIDWDGETPLFEECQVCGGTGKLPRPATETTGFPAAYTESSQNKGSPQ